MISDRARERWRLRREKPNPKVKHGTVGAAAIDARGQLAAATSTGGVPGKMAGRVGDSAIIGAGTFASAWGAASATGHGEAIMMASLCRETVEAFGASSPTRVAQIKVAELIAPRGYEAGIILVDRNRRVGYAHNAETMEVGIFHSSSGLTHRWAEPMPISRKPRI
jgi:beta-aspartyl-peptidase (threonine type)